ncbi:pyruvate carboxyltransferase|uniref:Homocitrate synthase NifV n=1 Tax=Dendrosporobacter quercicolus TaxID=146817 RepID=A0A1G9UB34_9FIRM|nr:hypothetical protein [Dendrosporobacter quercicolus]NSL49942.1 pyruvate carboxyltransferase [Dendrosporobacter quercicolus DSM 1736]SDM56755.1 homocitrate synthase NifV [Dendrosporobacter quercicolus]
MVKPPVFVDQTVNQGLKQNLTPDKFTQLVRLITEIRLDCADISVAAWQGMRQYPLAPMDSLRGNIEACCHQVTLAGQLGFKSVSIVIFACDQLNTSAVRLALAAAKGQGLTAALQIRNASALSIAQIAELAEKVDLAAADAVIYGDEGSLLDPLHTNRILTELQEKLPVELEFCAYNELGLAAANTLAALRAGIRRVATAVGGIDSFAAFEEILLGYKFLLNAPVAIGGNLASLSKAVLSLMGRELPANKPVIGTDVFAHESGIHVDGVIKNPELYEPFIPELVGLARKLVIGKHSGTASLKAKFRSWNRPLSDFDAAVLLGMVRKLAIAQKGLVNDRQLIDLYDEICGQTIYAEIEGDEICKAEKKYSSLTPHCGMGNKRPVLFSRPKKSSL